MSIKPVCDVDLSSDCEGELQDFGALLFSPPSKINGDCMKLHVCVPCWRFLVELGGVVWP